MEKISINLNKNKQQASPNFCAAKIPLTKTPKISQDTFKNLSLATGAIVAATLAMGKKENKDPLPTLEEFEKTLREMVAGPYNSPRFKEESHYDYLKKAYKLDPELTLRVVNLKTTNGEYIQKDGYDISCLVENYNKHPNLSETIFKEVQTFKNATLAADLLSYAMAKNDDEEILTKFYNIRSNRFKNPIISFHTLDYMPREYRQNTEVFEKILSLKTSDGDYEYTGADISRICETYKKKSRIGFKTARNNL